MSPQAGFLLQDQIIPRLKSAVPQVVNCVGSEDPAELEQDSIAFAANMIQNAELAGNKVLRSACGRGARKVKTVSAGNIWMPFVKDWLAAKRGAIELLSLVPVSCTLHFTGILILGIGLAVEWVLQTLSPSPHLPAPRFCLASPGWDFGGQV
jgi:hypothetical protein